MSNRPTLADVARRACVSKTTASLTLNDKGQGKIAPATRERVIAVAESMGFRPHGLALALVQRRSGTLGVVCTLNPFIELAHHDFEQALLSAVFYHALERGYNPMIYAEAGPQSIINPDLPHLDYDANTASNARYAKQQMARYADGRSDAFILLYPDEQSLLPSYLQAHNIPVVALCSQTPTTLINWVDSDHAAGVAAAVAHLADLGHQRIAYLIDPKVHAASHTRVLAFREAMQSHHLPLRDEWIVPYGVEANSVPLGDLMAISPAPTALLTWNDYVATQVSADLYRMGLRVPNDVSLIGFDDTTVARLAAPPLTTVRQNVVGMGCAAVDLALNALDEDPAQAESGSVLCSVQLVVRQSTAPPKRC